MRGIRIPEIQPESASALDVYAIIPSSFHVTAVLDIARVGDRFVLTERAIASPYIKDYDASPDNAPREWPRRFNVAHWGFFSAQVDGEWVGAAAVAPDPTLAPGAQASDAVLWDLRVVPEQRGHGIGSALVAAVEEWARAHGRSALLAETQHINVAANRFYASRSFLLEHVNAAAYRDFPDEVQLVWRKDLTVMTVINSAA